MTVKLVTNEKIAETSSMGNQEKWFDENQNKWYKLDQYGYEALSEAFISHLLTYSNLQNNSPFSFAKYDMERINVHGFERTGCSSENFLKEGQTVITLNKLLSKELGFPLRNKLEKLTSDKKRIAYIADAAAAVTQLEYFPEYLTLLFEIDSLFLNDDRHLNNIAIIEENAQYRYCPIFDNGAGLLSNAQIAPFHIESKAFITKIKASPFHMTFNRQLNTIRTLYGRQLNIPKFTKSELKAELSSFLGYYPERDREYIQDRVITCIIIRQKYM